MSTQNTSSAVMQQRAEPHDSLDDFPTPPWATRALIHNVLWPGCVGYDPRWQFQQLRVWEPACNRGHMAKPLAEFLGFVHASDVHDYGWDGQERVCDFLMAGSEPPHLADGRLDWIFTNPPFKLAQQFIERASDIRPRFGFAMFIRSAFVEGQERYETLFKRNPPSIVAQFTERVVIHRGKLRDPNRKYFDPAANDGTGAWKYPSTATAYCWLIWLDGEYDTRFVWIPPCRTVLERDGDYPVYADMLPGADVPGVSDGPELPLEGRGA